MRRLLLTIGACLALAIAGCGDDDSSTTSGSSGDETSAGKQAEAPEQKTKPKVTVPDGPPPQKLVINDLEEGTGATAKPGDEVTVNYVGVGYESGKEFDTSWGREPFLFGLGAGFVIPGWEKGVEGMKVGGRRELIVPPDLAYGAAGSPPVIGKNETLVFVIDLESVK